MSRISTLTTYRTQLEQALGSGALTVTLDGETTTFDNVDGLRSRLRWVNQEIDKHTGMIRRPTSAQINLSGGV